MCPNVSLSEGSAGASTMALKSQAFLRVSVGFM